MDDLQQKINDGKIVFAKEDDSVSITETVQQSLSKSELQRREQSLLRQIANIQVKLAPVQEALKYFEADDPDTLAKEKIEQLNG